MVSKLIQLMIILAGLLAALHLTGAPQKALAQGGVYYVAPTGNDLWSGTIAQPWRTIQKATNTLAAGDTVYIRAGTYNEQVIPQNSGSASNYITYAAYPGETVTIDGTAVTLSAGAMSGLVEVSSLSYIKISGLKIINAGQNNPNSTADDNHAGILVDNSDHIIIEKNYTYNTVSSGIGVWGGNNIIIDGNEVVLANNDGEQENITVAGTNIFEIKNNHVHDGGPGSNGGEGIDAKDGAANGKIYGNHVHYLNRLGIYVDAWDKPTSNIEVYQNIVHDISSNDGFTVASEAGGLLENIRFYNNLAYNNGVAGFNLSRNGPALSHPMKDIKIINNTFYNNGGSGWGGGIVLDNPNIQNVVIRNNIVSQNVSFQIEAEADVPANQLTVDYNLIDGYRNYPGETRGSSYVEGDPKFLNAAGADFHLQNNSPAINKGSAADAPLQDFDGNDRPQGTAYDIGAYEVVTGVPPAFTTHLPLILSSGSATSPLPLSGVTYWAYQIQELSAPGAVPTLVNSHYDMLVLEPTRTDWSSDDKFLNTKDMVAQLKNSQASDGLHRKRVIAYIDIGEAEDWRWYWTWSTGWDCQTPKPADWPAYILTCDPDGWGGNYPVAYWHSTWKDIIIYGQNTGSHPDRDYASVIDEVIKDGFDGIYLDWVEGYENSDVVAAAQAAGKDPAAEMISFIQEMRAYAIARNPNFIIIQQNAVALLDGHPERTTTINAIAQEAIWFDGDATDNWNDPNGYDFTNSASLTNYYLGYLDQYKNAGLPVFNCEYALNYANAAYANAYNKGYVPYATRRSLSKLTTTPPPGY